jgi:ABC-type polysaccharide transport system permease subunit
MQRLMVNKKLLLIAVPVVLLVLVLALVVLLPLLGQALGMVDSMGLKGILERLWMGAGAK